MSVNAGPNVAVFGARDIDTLPGLADIRDESVLTFATSERELGDAIEDTDVLLIWDFKARVLERLWSRARRLQWVHWASAGVDTALFPELRESDVALTNARGVFDHAMAEYVLGLVLCFAKGFPRTIRAQSHRQWDFRYTESIKDRAALVVGVGNIGSAIGAMLRSAGMRVTGVGRMARSGDPVFGDVHALDDLDGLLGEADYVVSVTPSTPDTRGLFSADRFNLMKTNARFINVGRGDAVDEDALADALRNGRITGAALDVFTEEPLPAESPLWELHNLIVSPHMSGDIHGSDGVLIKQFTDNLRRFVRGEPLNNVVDKRKGY